MRMVQRSLRNSIEHVQSMNWRISHPMKCSVPSVECSGMMEFFRNITSNKNKAIKNDNDNEDGANYFESVAFIFL
jgi:hypothetical protein